jgi:hypothetical protein
MLAGKRTVEIQRILEELFIGSPSLNLNLICDFANI